MAFTPYYTSTDLINAVKRKIAMPLNQNTFEATDILAFANEEMMISQVPSVLSYHDEYFVFNDSVDVVANQSNYALPERAIGMKLRAVFYQDTSGNLFEMSRIAPEEKAYYQNNGSNNFFQKFYLEGNDIVLTPTVNAGASGSLIFNYYLRPNQLVENDRAAIISSFGQTVTCVNASIVALDTVTIDDVVFTAVASGATGNQFNIGATSTLTATNLVTAVNANGVCSATNGASPTAVVSLSFSDVNLVVETSNSAGFTIPVTQVVNFTEVPDNITAGLTVDFLQTKPGHRTYSLDALIPTNGVSGNSILFSEGDVPTNCVVGDYVCLSNECIIPQIPTDLHPGLAEKTCARILAALGDQAGLSATNAKIAEIRNAEGALLDNRVEGAPKKVTNLKSILRFGKFTSLRRF